MTASSVGVRIVVAAADASAGSAVARALETLGADARVERAPSLERAIALAREPATDLVVQVGEPSRALLAALRGGGPPVVVVAPGADEARALEAFGLGAADCVTSGPECARVLPVVALEQIRRHRAARERERVETLTRYNEQIIEHMNSALVVVDAEGRIAFCNRSAEEVLGVPRAALVGRTARELFPDAPRGRELFEKTLAGGERFRGEETLLTRSDGRRVPIGVSCAPLEDAAGRRLGAVAIFQDLSEVKQLQQQVLQTEKMASIGQLAAGVAHEINNPMGFIHANLFQLNEYAADLGRIWDRVEALQEAVGRGKPDEIRTASEELDHLGQELDARFLLADLGKAIRESLEGSERIRHIVRDLREFSHQGGDDRAPADLSQCLDSTANIVWSMMKHAAVLERDYAPLPPVPCHPMQLKQVFMNLLVNAYQAIEARGGEGPGTIRLRTRVEGDTAVIAVEDDGAGIPAEVRDRIFDPFFTTKEVGIGTGLGLSTSFHIVQRHGGTIRVRSEPGRGSVFEVVLPLRGPGGARDA